MNLLTLFDEIGIIQSKFKSLLLKEVINKDDDIKSGTYVSPEFMALNKENERLQKLINKLYLEIEIKDKKLQQFIGE